MRTHQILQLDQPTHETGLVYPSDVMAKAVATIERRTLWGTWGMPQDLKGGLPVEQLSHRVHNLRIEDGWLVGDVQPLQTPLGRSLERALENSESQVQFRLASFVHTHDHCVAIDQPPQKIVSECNIAAVAALCPDNGLNKEVQMETKENRVRLIALAPTASGKTAILSEIKQALQKRPTEVIATAPDLSGPNAMTPSERLRDFELYRPVVELIELTPYQAMSYLPREIRKIAEDIARSNPSDATKAMLRQALHELQGHIEEIRSWAALQ